MTSLRALGGMALVLVASEALGAPGRAPAVAPSTIDDHPGAGITVSAPWLPRAGSGGLSSIIFLNRCAGGCEIVAGTSNDARVNRSTIPTSDARISEFSHGDAIWAEVVACVAEIYQPYDIVVTDVDPAPMAHHEAIVAGSPGQLGLGASIGGIAPAVCVAQDNVMSFTFANFYSADARRICEVVAEESAHTLGLDHVMACADPLTRLPACGLQYFRDQDSPCGEFAERSCACGGTTQNSHRALLALFGAGAPTPAPAPTILLPASGESVPTAFSIYAEVSSRRGIRDVQLWINGSRVDTISGQSNNDRYIFETGDYLLADGVLDVEIRASDDLSSEGRTTVTVTKGAPCATAEQCFAGQTCSAGRCAFPPPTGELGSPCASAAECLSAVCETNGVESRCTQSCTPEVDDSCASAGGEFECVASGASGICWQRERRPDAGCSAAGPGPATLSLGWWLVASFGFALRGALRPASRAARARRSRQR